jgi:recombination protein RecT
MSDSSVKKDNKVSGLVPVRQAGKDGLELYLNQFLPKVDKRKPRGSTIDPQRVMEIVKANVIANDNLQSCTMVSIVRATLRAVELGLIPGSALQEAHLVPFGSECQMIPDYRGLCKLAYNSGYISSIDAGAVYEGDEFVYERGLHPILKHVPSDEEDATKVKNVWCVIRLVTGGVVTDVMTRKQIDRIRNKSRAKNNGPWVTDYAAMAVKTVVKRALKLAPKSGELSKALYADDEADTGMKQPAVFESDADTIEGQFVDEPAKGTDHVKSRLGAKEAKPEPDKAPLIDQIKSLSVSKLSSPDDVEALLLEMTGRKIAHDKLDELTFDECEKVLAKLQDGQTSLV